MEIIIEEYGFVERTATVVFGPTCWLGKSGTVKEEDGTKVLIEILAKDDGKDGDRPYLVRMPKECIKFADKVLS